MALEPITRQEQIISGKDLKPITRMEKFLKQYGGGSGGGGVTSWNDLKDKPFYSETETVTVLERQTFAFAPQESFGGLYGSVLGNFDISADDFITVLWDGVEYKPMPFGPGFGNGALIGGETDTGEPFAIVNFGEFAALTSDDAASHEISIVITRETVRTLDEKYLPNSVIVVNLEFGRLKSHTFDEIQRFLEKGGCAVLRDGEMCYHLSSYNAGRMTFFTAWYNGDMEIFVFEWRNVYPDGSVDGKNLGIGNVEVSQ